jgi:ubiquinone/menaquinone biosynthesis C-methylase UbiE
MGTEPDARALTPPFASSWLARRCDAKGADVADQRYALQLSPAELGRYRAMARDAVDREGEDWVRCGAAPGAHVADIGCGPGAVLVELARLVGPSGRAVGIDQDEGAVAAARSLLEEAGVRNAEVTAASATDTGLEPDAFDLVMIRHVLAHNGPDVVAENLRHAASLLRPGGCLWVVDVAADAIFADPAAPAVVEVGRRYRLLHERAGHLLNVGSVLGSLLVHAGLALTHRDASFSVLSPFPPSGGPLGAAEDALLATGLATTDEITAFRRAAADLAADPDSALFIPLFVAAGRRPETVTP